MTAVPAFLPFPSAVPFAPQPSRPRATGGENRTDNVARAQSHFLFNALQVVDTLVRLQRNDEASRAIHRLADLNRRLVEREDYAFVTVDEEIALAELSLGFERVRFGDGFKVSIEVAPEARPLLLPNLILLPLVENAVKHGIARRMGYGRIDIYAGRRGPALLLEVRNDPPLRDKHSLAGLGYGLRSTRERLAALYGDAATFSFTARPGQGVVASLSLPV